MGLRVTELSKCFTRKDQSHQALKNVSFSVPRGAFVTLLGPSGCGKSTLLNMIAGLDQPTSGSIEIGGRPVYDSSRRLFVPPAMRDISMVFQSYAIWPHMTVRENVDFPLRHGRKKWSEADREATVTRSLAKVHLDSFQDRPAPLLSGGQQQRVSLARAIAQSPSLILLDEPLSNLDANLRDAMQKEIRSIVTDEGITAVYVTHDQKEALSMSDIIIVMKDGHVEQIGNPDDVYYRPQSRFVAEFMGAPNLLGAIVVAADKSRGDIEVECALGRVWLKKSGLEVNPGDQIVIVLKQEDVVIDLVPEASSNTFALPIVRRVFLGDRMEIVCALGGADDTYLSVYVNARTLVGSDTLRFRYRPEEIHYFRGP
ncbi:MAG: ABC transporter ATP-binding protein [Pusillimonas sp.]